MQRDECIKLLESISERTRKFLTYRSNNLYSDEQAFHRVFWLTAMRAQKDAHGTKENIRQWALDLKAEKVSPVYYYRKVDFKLFGSVSKTNLLWDIYRYIDKLPICNRKDTHKDGKPVTPFEYSEARAKNAVKFGIGNCGEHADVNFVLLQEYAAADNHFSKTEKIRIERIIINTKECNHGFVIVGRDLNTDLDNPLSWNKGVYIIDTWLTNKIICVDDEIAQYKATQTFSDEFTRYIWKHRQDLRKKATSFIGEGHTERWNEKRKKKNPPEPLQLIDWPVFFETHPEEKTPWTKETAFQKKKYG